MSVTETSPMTKPDLSRSNGIDARLGSSDVDNAVIFAKPAAALSTTQRIPACNADVQVAVLDLTVSLTDSMRCRSTCRRDDKTRS